MVLALISAALARGIMRVEKPRPPIDGPGSRSTMPAIVYVTSVRWSIAVPSPTLDLAA